MPEGDKMKIKLQRIICLIPILFIVACQSEARVADLSDQMVTPESEAGEEAAVIAAEELDIDELPVYEPEAEPIEESYEQPSSDAIALFIEQMSLDEKIGQLFMPSITLGGKWITSYTRAYARELAAVKPGGLIVYRNNIESSEQLRQLLDDIQRDVAIPLIISIDYEGGRVNRLRGIDDPLLKNFPSPAVLATLEDLDFIEELAEYSGKQLRSLGITMNLAPLADVLTNEDNISIGDRSYGNNPRTVGNIVDAYVRGLQSANVSAVVKHFPGQGSAKTDSHFLVTISEHDGDALRQDVIPFLAGINAGVDAFMTSHVIYPNIYNDELPASLSKFYIHDLLRSRMDYNGLVITDSLSMRGVIDAVPNEDLAVLAVNAGNDFMLKPKDLRVSIAQIKEGVRDQRINEQSIDSSIRRILLTKIKRGLIEITEDGLTSLYRTPTNDYIGSAESERLYKELVDRLAGE